MSWYQCTARTTCGSAMDVVTIHRKVFPLQTSERMYLCIDCGAPAQFVIDTEEGWFLSMEKAFALDRPLLLMLLREWGKQRNITSFSDWLAIFEQEDTT